MKSEQIWNTPKGRMAIGLGVPLCQVFVRDHFGLWLAAHVHIDILTIDAQRITDWIVIALSAASGTWGWINKRVPTWAALLALLGATIYFAVFRTGDASWRVQHYTEMATAGALGAAGLALVVWRIWRGLSPNTPNTLPITGTAFVANLVER